jgi:hypothetical protein
MAALQKYCAYCGKRTKNAGFWRYSPIFCNHSCEELHLQRHKQLIKDNPKYASRDKIGTYAVIGYLLVFGVLPIMILLYQAIF